MLKPLPKQHTVPYSQHPKKPTKMLGSHKMQKKQKCTQIKPQWYNCNTKFKLEKVALDGSVECCAPPPRWCDLDL